LQDVIRQQAVILAALSTEVRSAVLTAGVPTATPAATSMLPPVATPSTPTPIPTGSGGGAPAVPRMSLRRLFPLPWKKRRRSRKPLPKSREIADEGRRAMRSTRRPTSAVGSSTEWPGNASSRERDRGYCRELCHSLAATIHRMCQQRPLRTSRPGLPLLMQTMRAQLWRKTGRTPRTKQRRWIPSEVFSEGPATEPATFVGGEEPGPTKALRLSGMDPAAPFVPNSAGIMPASSRPNRYICRSAQLALLPQPCFC